MKHAVAVLFFASALFVASGVRAAEAYGIGLEGFPYPYPVSMLAVPTEGEALRMAYMDVNPTGGANGRTVLLLHGRNFPSSYWEPTIKALTAAGYRVVVPDQIGFGNSSKPLFELSFDMLGVPFSRAYPARVDRLVLEAPIGLEDYRNFAPPVETERLLAIEDALTPDGYRQQLVTNYSLTRSEEQTSELQ